MSRQSGNSNRHGHGSDSARPPEERSPAASVPSPPDVVMQEVSGRANDPGRTVSNVVHGEAPLHSAATARPSVAVMNSRGQPSRVNPLANDSPKFDETDSDDDIFGDMFRPPTPPNRPSRVLTTICLDADDQYNYDERKRFLIEAYHDKIISAVEFNKLYRELLQQYKGVVPEQRNAAPSPRAVERATSEAISPVVTDTGFPDSSSVMGSGTAGGTTASLSARSGGGIDANEPRPWLQLTSTPKRKPSVVKELPKSDVKRSRQEEHQPQIGQTDTTPSTHPASRQNASIVATASPQCQDPRPMEAATEATPQPAEPSSENVNRSSNASREATTDGAEVGNMPSSSRNNTSDDYARYNLQLQRRDRQELDSRMASRRRNLPILPPSALATSHTPFLLPERVHGSPSEPTIYNLREHMQRVFANAFQRYPRNDAAEEEANKSSSSSSDVCADNETEYDLHGFLQNLLLPRSQRQPRRRRSPVLPPPSLAVSNNAPFQMAESVISPSEPTLFDVERSAQMDAIESTPNMMKAIPLRMFPKPMEEVVEVTEPINPTPEWSLESESLAVEDTQEVSEATEITASDKHEENEPKKAKSPEKSKEDSKASYKFDDVSKQPISAITKDNVESSFGRREEGSETVEQSKNGEDAVPEKFDSGKQSDEEQGQAENSEASAQSDVSNQSSAIIEDNAEASFGRREEGSKVVEKLSSEKDATENADTGKQSDEQHDQIKKAEVEGSASTESVQEVQATPKHIQFRSEQEEQPTQTPTTSDVKQSQDAEAAHEVVSLSTTSSASSDKQENEKKEKSKSPGKKEEKEDSAGTASSQSKDASKEPEAAIVDNTTEATFGRREEGAEAVEQLKNGADVTEKAESVTASDTQKEGQSSPSQFQPRSEQQEQPVQTNASSIAAGNEEVQAPSNKKDGQSNDQTPAESAKIQVPSRLTQLWHAQQEKLNEQQKQNGDTNTETEVVEHPSSPNNAEIRSEQQDQPVQTNASSIAAGNEEVQAPSNKKDGPSNDQTPAESVKIQVPSRFTQWLRAKKDKLNEQQKQNDDTNAETEVVERPSPVLTSSSSQITTQVESRAASPPASKNEEPQTSDDSNNGTIEVEMEEPAVLTNASIIEAASLDGIEADMNAIPAQPTAAIPASEPPSQQARDVTAGIRKLIHDQLVHAKELKKAKEIEQPSATAVPRAVPTSVAAPAPAPPMQLRTAARLAELLARSTPEEQNVPQNRDAGTEKQDSVDPSDQGMNVDADSANNASERPGFNVEGSINIIRSRLEGARQVHPTTGRPGPPVATAPTTAPIIQTEPIRNEVVDESAAVDRTASPNLQNIVGVNGNDSNRSENGSASSGRQDHDKPMPPQPSQSPALQPSISPSLAATIEAIKKLVRQSLEQPAGNEAAANQSLNAHIETELKKYMKSVPHKCSTCGQNCNGCPIQPANGASKTGDEHQASANGNTNDPEDSAADGNEKAMNAEDSETASNVNPQSPNSPRASSKASSEPADSNIPIREPADNNIHIREPSEVSLMETDDSINERVDDGSSPIVPMNDSDFEPIQLSDFEDDMVLDEPQLPPSTPERVPTPRPPTPMSRSLSPVHQLSPRQPTPLSRSPTPDGHLCGRHCRCPIMFEPPKNRRPARPAPYRRVNPRQNRPRLQPEDRAPRRRQTDAEFGRLQHIRNLAGANLPDAPPVVDAEQTGVVDGIHLDAANQVSVVRGEHFEAALYRSGVVVARGYFEGGSTASMSIRNARNQPIPLFNQPDDPATSIAGGPNHLVILTRSGHLYTIGRAIEGQLGVAAYNLERYRQSSITPASMLRRVFDGNREVLFSDVWVHGNVTVAVDRVDAVDWRCGEEHGPVFRKINQPED